MGFLGVNTQKEISNHNILNDYLIEFGLLKYSCHSVYLWRKLEKLLQYILDPILMKSNYEALIGREIFL